MRNLRKFYEDLHELLKKKENEQLEMLEKELEKNRN